MRRFNLSAFAVRQRTLTLFLILAIVAAGAFSFLRLGRAEDPDFTMKLPETTIIARRKVEGYLLQTRPEDDKSGFLALAGYTLENADKLLIDLRELGREFAAAYPANPQAPVADPGSADPRLDIGRFA